MAASMGKHELAWEMWSFCSHRQRLRQMSYPSHRYLPLWKRTGKTHHLFMKQVEPGYTASSHASWKSRGLRYPYLWSVIRDPVDPMARPMGSDDRWLWMSCWVRSSVSRCMYTSTHILHTVHTHKAGWPEPMCMLKSKWRTPSPPTARRHDSALAFLLSISPPLISERVS